MIEKLSFDLVDIELQLLITRGRDNDTFDELSFFCLIKRICVPCIDPFRISLRLNNHASIL